MGIIKKSSRHGVVSQKMMSFRIDLDLLPYLSDVPNKGKLINDLIRFHFNVGSPD